MATKLDELEQRISELETATEWIKWVISQFGIWAGVTGVTLAVMSIGAATIGAWAWMVFNRTKKDAEKASREALQLLDTSKIEYEENIGKIQTLSTDLDTRLDILTRTAADIITARVLYRNAEFKTSLQYYQKAKIHDPNNLEIGYYEGRCNTYLDSMDAASIVFTQAIEQHPRSSRMYRGRAYNLRFQDVEKAMEDIECAIKYVDQESIYLRVRLLNDKGLFLRDQLKFKSSMLCHDEALELDTDNLISFYFKALARGCWKQGAEAKEDIRIASEKANQRRYQNVVRQIWLDTMKWSEVAISNRNDEATELWEEKLVTDRTSDYMKNTLLKNANCVAKIAGIDRVKIAPT